MGVGSYTVTVNQGGCSATASAAVSATGGPSILATATATTCGRNNGAAQVTVNSGSGPYTYAWTGGGTGQSITNLALGNYSVTVTDVNHCPAVANANVAGSTAPVLIVTAANASCGKTRDWRRFEET